MQSPPPPKATEIIYHHEGMYVPFIVSMVIDGISRPVEWAGYGNRQYVEVMGDSGPIWAGDISKLMDENAGVPVTCRDYAGRSCPYPYPRNIRPD